MQIDSYLSACRKLKSKWIKHYNKNPVTLNLGSNLPHTGTGDIFLNITPMAQTLRSTINKWYLLKENRFCIVNDTIKKTKQKPYQMGIASHHLYI